MDPLQIDMNLLNRSLISLLFLSLTAHIWTSLIQAAPIPPGAVFWVSYDDDLPGHGDKMMAQKLCERIRKLGYSALFFAHSTPPQERSPSPDVILQVPHKHSSLPITIPSVRSAVLQECGYPPLDGSESLGMRMGHRDEFLGLLLDPELVQRYQADPRKTPEKRALAYLELSPEIRTHLDPLLGLSPASLLPEITHQLSTSDLYFGYSQSIFSQQTFAETARILSESAHRRPIVILTGGDFNKKLRAFNSSFKSVRARITSPQRPTGNLTSSSSSFSPFFASWSHDTASGTSSDTSVAQGTQGSEDLSAGDFFSPEFYQPTASEQPISHPILLQLPQVEHSDFKLLLYLSSLALVTGDRSTEESLSAGTPFLYERLAHKREFAEQLQQFSYLGLISIIQDTERFREGLIPHEELKSRNLLRQVPSLVLSISLAQNLAQNPEEPDYYHFFTTLQNDHYLNDERLRQYLEAIFDQKPTHPYVAGHQFEVGALYLLSWAQIIELKISTSTGKCLDPKVIEQLGLTPSHHFALKWLAPHHYSVSLQSR